MDHNRNAKIGRSEIIRALGIEANVVKVVLRHLVEKRRIILRGDGRATYQLIDRIKPRSRRRLATRSS